MPAARTCPLCNRQTFYDKRSHRACANCGFVGWPWHTPVEGVGSGKGRKCLHCGTQKLHDIGSVDGTATVYRCATCDFTGVGSGAR